MTLIYNADMKKLQLYITMSKGDFRNVVDINAEPGVKALVGDLRSAVCQVDYQASAKNIFYLMKYTDTGVFIIVLRTIPDIAGNYLAAWIYAPYSCSISDKDLCSVVEFVSERVAGHSLTNQIFGEIRSVFAQEYEDSPLAPIFAPTEGKAYAYRYYNGNTGTTLADLIGRFRYQACYLPFAGVLLVDAAVSDNVSGTNLTSAPKETMATLLPPPAVGTDGYAPTIYACPFDVPYFAPMDRTFDIIWRKPGSPDIKQPVTVSKSEMQAPAFEEYTRPVTVHAERPERRTEPAAKPAQKQVYKPVIDDEIDTEPSRPAYNDNLEDEGGVFDRYSGLITKLLYAAGGFALGVVVTLLCTCSREDEPIETPHPATPVEQEQPSAQTVVDAIVDVADAQPAAQPAATAQEVAAEPAASAPAAAAQETAAPQPESSLQDAIAYLDKNTTWTKAEMEKYPDLRGLYDDMNNINRKAIIDKWGPKLKASTRFQNIVKHAKYSLKKKARRTPYNTPKSTTIQIQGFLNNMDP